MAVAVAAAAAAAAVAAAAAAVVGARRQARCLSLQVAASRPRSHRIRCQCWVCLSEPIATAAAGGVAVHHWRLRGRPRIGCTPGSDAMAGPAASTTGICHRQGRREHLNRAAAGTASRGMVRPGPQSNQPLASAQTQQLLVAWLRRRLAASAPTAPSRSIGAQGLPPPRLAVSSTEYRRCDAQDVPIRKLLPQQYVGRGSVVAAPPSCLQCGRRSSCRPLAAVASGLSLRVCHRSRRELNCCTQRE